MLKNGKKTKLILMLASVMSLALLMTGCTTFDNFKYTFLTEPQKDSENTIYIGVFEPQTGEAAEKGLEEIKGIELAHSIYNNVNGCDIKLIKVDTQSNTKSAETAIANLTELKPAAIIGSAEEASSLIASKYIDNAKIPTITPSAVNPLITQDNGFYFRACITDAQMGAGIAEYMCSKLKTTKAAFIGIKNDSTIAAITEGFNTELNRIIGSGTNPVVYRANVSVTDNNWDDLIKNLKEKEVDTVFLPLSSEQLDSFMTAAEKKGLKQLTIIGTRAWGTGKYAKVDEKHPNYKLVFPYDSVINEDNTVSDTVTKETQRFIIEYSNKYGADDEPTQRAALGYDSYLLLINAINNAKSTDGEAIRDALANLKNITGATGVFVFDERGNTVRKVNIAAFKDGKIVSDYITQGTTEAQKIEAVK